MIYHSWSFGTSTTLVRSNNIFLLVGMKVLIQYIPIYLASLKVILMFLFDLLFFLAFLAGISIALMQ